MNSYRLDSHGLLWWWIEPQRLSHTVAGLRADSRSPVHGSVASIWKLSLQCHRGRLPELAGAYRRAHRESLDRLQAAQAEVEQLVLLTADPQLAAFPCTTLW
jgi:PIN domain nuclease of toxin-antitoxin system